MDQNQKKDAGKPFVSLILGGFRRALEGVSRVGEFGMKKYTRNGWDKVDGWRQRYGEALGRHALEVQEGVNYSRDMYDPETGLLSELAVAWNALALAELKLREGVPLRNPHIEITREAPEMADTKIVRKRNVDCMGYRNGIPMVDLREISCEAFYGSRVCHMSKEQHAKDNLHSDGEVVWLFVGGVK